MKEVVVTTFVNAPRERVFASLQMRRYLLGFIYVAMATIHGNGVSGEVT